MKRVQRWAEWAPVAVIGGAMLWYALLDGDQRASESLYEMAAQIIPVLILALALESQVKDRWRKWRGAFRLQTILALLLGELAAVLAAALGQVTKGEYLVYKSQELTDVLSWLTVLGLVVGFAAVLWAALGQEEWAMRKQVTARSAGSSVSTGSAMGRGGFEPPHDGS